MVRDFLAGTSSGLEGVYAAYGRPLYAVARNVLGNDDDAQDCVHDALVRIWQRSESYRRERGSLRTCLLVSVRNEALTRKRNAARHLNMAKNAQRSKTVKVSAHGYPNGSSGASVKARSQNAGSEKRAASASISTGDSA